MSMPKSLQKIHVAVLAFPFGSHPRTLMSLSLKLANSAPNILFSFFNTQKSNDSLLSSSKLDIPINFKIYNVDDGVPLDHCFAGNPLEPLDLFLKAAPENLRRSMEMAVSESGINISSLITDAFLTFAGEIAENFQSFWIPIWVCMPSCLSAHVYTQLIREKCSNVSTGLKDQKLEFIPGLSMMCVKDLPAEILSVDNSIFSKTLAQTGQSLSKATAVAVCSFEELNPELLNNDLKSKFKQFLNLGFMSLPPPPSDSDQTGCLSWLDKQPPKSVVYIGFGTVAALPEKELKALAEALETSKHPFLWALKDNLMANLPNGFVERTSKQGKIVAWAPQTLVLAHNSVAVYITHAGFISVGESIVSGVPIICRPVLGDNRFAGKMVEDGWGIGLTFEDGVITVKGMLKKLEMFLPADNEQGKKMRDNLQELKKVVLTAAQPSGSAARDLKKLLEIISML